VAARLDAETQRMAAVLKQKPVFSGSQFRGVLIESGDSPGMLERLGLKPGDVLHHVNGAMIADPSRADLLRQALASGKSVQVGITRPGEGPLDLTLDSSLVAGLVQQ
jgi:type II secretory pathway component PulC